MRCYAIGDIHGQLDLLIAVHASILADMAVYGPAPVVHIGDLVDRGPDSCGVIEYRMAGQARGESWIVLKGNHDRMFTLFLDDPSAQDPGLRREYSWLHPALGGAATLASYGVHAPADRPLAPVHADAVNAVPPAHRNWLKALPAMHRLGDVVFVHAGIRPGVPLESQQENDLVWIREPFLSCPDDYGFLVVHGHTALDAPHHYGNRVNVDSGAGYGRPLSAVVIEGRSAFHLTEAGRLPLLPAA